MELDYAIGVLVDGGCDALGLIMGWRDHCVVMGDQMIKHRDSYGVANWGVCSVGTYAKHKSIDHNHMALLLECAYFVLGSGGWLAMDLGNSIKAEIVYPTYAILGKRISKTLKTFKRLKKVDTK